MTGHLRKTVQGEPKPEKAILNEIAQGVLRIYTPRSRIVSDL
jgi:hypothetical protein